MEAVGASRWDVYSHHRLRILERDLLESYEVVSSKGLYDVLF